MREPPSKRDRDRPTSSPPWPDLRDGAEVDAVFACARKDRLTARSGSTYLALELRDRTGSIPARAFRGRRLPRRASSTAATSCGWPGRVERFRDELQIDVRSIQRVDERARSRRLPADGLPRPRGARRLPRALRARGARPRLPPAAGRHAGRRAIPRVAAPRAVLARRAPRLPRRAARAHRGGGHARRGGLRAAPAAELRPPDHRSAAARHRQGARVRLHGGDRAQRRGRAGGPRGARASS